MGGENYEAIKFQSYTAVVFEVASFSCGHGVRIGVCVCVCVCVCVAATSNIYCGKYSS